MSKVFKCTEAHEEGFKECLKIHLDTQIDSVKLPPDILSNIILLKNKKK